MQWDGKGAETEQLSLTQAFPQPHPLRCAEDRELL